MRSLAALTALLAVVGMLAAPASAAEQSRFDPDGWREGGAVRVGLSGGESWC